MPHFPATFQYSGNEIFLVMQSTPGATIPGITEESAASAAGDDREVRNIEKTLDVSAIPVHWIAAAYMTHF